jgi:beta-alanine degradation protein BauB
VAVADDALALELPLREGTLLVGARIVEDGERAVAEPRDRQLELADSYRAELGPVLGRSEARPFAHVEKCRVASVSGPQASSALLVENDRVRVTQWRFAPGEATGWHRHELDYVIVPVTDGTLLIDNGSSETEVELTAGGPYFREAGVEHDVANGGERELVFVEVELKP